MCKYEPAPVASSPTSRALVIGDVQACLWARAECEYLLAAPSSVLEGGASDFAFF